jgi:hypothetical protein
VSDTGAERWLYVLDRGATTPRLVWHDQRDTRIYPAYVARWHPDGRIVVVADTPSATISTRSTPRQPNARPVALTSGEWDVTASVAPRPCRCWRRLIFTATMKNPYERPGLSAGAGGGRPRPRC